MLKKQELKSKLKRKVAPLFVTLILMTMSTLSFDVELAKANQEIQLSLETDKNVYNLGENVTITLTNIGDDTVMFGGWPPWIIYTYPYWERVYPESLVYLAWDLDPGESETLSWNQYNEYNDTFVSSGRYVVWEHNYDHMVFLDIASSTSCATDNLNISLTVFRQAIVVGEELNINISATNIGSDNVTLQPCYGSNVFDIVVFNETFSWKWSDGMYWIMIVFPPIVLSPGETYVEQKEWNLFIYSYGEFISPTPGNYTLAVLSLEIICTPMMRIQFINPSVKADVNRDGKVDIYDVVIVAGTFGSKPGAPDWNPKTDLVQDELIDIFDVVLLAKNFGKTA